MGNLRFRFSDMMPNAWFYKLKDIGRIRNQNSNQGRRKKHPPTTSSSTTTTTISTSSSSSSASSSLSTANNAIQQQPHQPADLLSHQRKSYYFTRDLTSPPLPHSPPTYPTESNNHPDHLPRKSQKQSRSSRRKRASTKTPSKLVTTSSSSCVSAGCSCRPTADSVCTKPDSTSKEYPNSPLGSSSDLHSLVPEFGSDHDPALHSDSSNGTVQCSGSCHCRVEKDIVVNINDQSLDPKFDGFNTIPDLELPPIITQKPSTRKDATQVINKKKKKNDCNDPTKYRKFSAKSEDRNASGSTSVKEEQRTSLVRRLSVSSPGLRLRTNSPRIASKKIQAHARKSVSSSTTSRRSLSESFAVMKSSADPQRDFRESMVEMILENNIKASKELEDLLACYLQLNSDEYHELIIKVFKQIWFDLEDARLN